MSLDTYYVPSLVYSFSYSVQSTVTKKAKDEETSKPASALDQALNLIKGPKAINTVSKSSMDWENYKEKEGLQDDLAHSKEK